MARPDIKYTKTHEWVRAEGDMVVVGITDFAVAQLGDLAFVDLLEVGTEVEAGKPFGEIESTKAVEDLYAPVSGKIVEVNEELEDNTDPIDSAPFEDGWMIKIELRDTDELGQLLDAEAYQKHIESQQEH